MKKALHYCTKVESAIVVITFAIMIVAIFLQVLNRNIFKIPLSGFEEAAKYSMVYMVLLGTEMGLRDGTQIAITGLADSMHGLAKKTVQIISKSIVVLFTGAMLYQGIGMVVKQVQTGQTSPGLGIPMYIPYFAFVFCFGIMACVQLAELVLIIKNKPDEKSGEDQMLDLEEGTDK